MTLYDYTSSLLHPSAANDGGSGGGGGEHRQLPVKHFIKFVLKLLLSFVVLMALGLALYCSLWLAFQPNPPVFTVVSGSMSKLELRGSDLSAHWALDIQAHNPNSVGQIFTFDYQTLVAFVSYHSDFPLAGAHLMPFSQVAGNRTVVRAKVDATGQYLNHRVRKRLEDDLSRGVVEFDVKVATKYRYPYPNVVYTGTGSVSCNRVMFEVDGSGSMVGAYPRVCKEEGDERTAALKKMWFMVFVVSFVYLIVDVVM